LKVLDKIDSTGHKGGYFHKVKLSNKTHLKKVMNGMKSFEDLNFLKVKGVNQMAKEIAETHDLDRKVIDRAALHRNEQSNEYEGMVQTMANNLFINLS